MQLKNQLDDVVPSYIFRFHLIIFYLFIYSHECKGKVHVTWYISNYLPGYLNTSYIPYIVHTYISTYLLYQCCRFIHLPLPPTTILYVGSRKSTKLYFMRVVCCSSCFAKASSSSSREVEQVESTGGVRETCCLPELTAWCASASASTWLNLWLPLKQPILLFGAKSHVVVLYYSQIEKKTTYTYFYPVVQNVLGINYIFSTLEAPYSRPN